MLIAVVSDPFDGESIIEILGYLFHYDVDFATELHDNYNTVHDSVYPKYYCPVLGLSAYEIIIIRF